jgi:hypothetical protein
MRAPVRETSTSVTRYLRSSSARLAGRPDIALGTER